MILISSLLLLLLLSAAGKMVKYNDRAIVFFDTISAFTLLVVFTVSYFNGVDWTSYSELYLSISTVIDFDSPYEPIFSFLFKFLTSIGFDFYFAIAFYFFIAVLIIWAVALKLKVPLSIVGLVVVMFFYFDLFSDAIRQAFSVVLCLLAIIFLINGKMRFFIFISILAVGFHYSAIVFVVYSIVSYFFVFKLNKSYTYVFNFIVFLLGFIFIPLVLSDFRYYVDLVLGESFNGLRIVGNIISELKVNQSRYGLFIILDLLFIFLSLAKISSKSVSRFEVFIFSGVFSSSCLHFAFYSFPLLQRVTQYFYIFQCIFLFYFYAGYIDSKKLLNLTTLFLIASFSILFFYKNITNDIRRDLIYAPLIYEDRESLYD